MLIYHLTVHICSPVEINQSELIEEKRRNCLSTELSWMSKYSFSNRVVGVWNSYQNEIYVNLC